MCHLLHRISPKTDNKNGECGPKLMYAFEESIVFTVLIFTKFALGE